MYLDSVPNIEIKNFARIFRETILQRLKWEAEGDESEDFCFEQTMCFGDFVLNDIHYRYTLLDKDEEGHYSVLFEWKCTSGKQCSEKVYLRQTENNIAGLSSYFYFVCPYSHTLCRKLFADREGNLAGKRAFAGAHYRSQYEKHRTLKSSSVYARIKSYIDLAALQMEDPYRKFGKEYYKGKLTPYGKRLQRYEEKCNKITANIPL